ncbi:TonB-dependent receptor plug domain-containing protein [Epilithonimonas sp. UC225_85]|uniref:TonB-dependent receptor plug domain-containing protein n=1 Tax=Epilithonimonas sp. UC225_85 TaxID=3350167 RepID=UPI0036D26E7F
MKRIFTLFSLVILHQFSAQESLIDTVYIDNQFNKVGRTAKISNLNSVQILENSTSLSDLLRFQSNIYIKENGRGSTSSPSFRGTGASRTAFVWNGINVNSIFLGQGDINNLNLLSYENVGIKFGGGSVIYGSGAVGGSVHLNNTLDFDKGFHGILFSEYGSFGTFNSFIKAKYSNAKLSFSFSANHSQSENDYKVAEKNYINRNGRYQNTGFNLGLAYKISDNNEFYWQSQHYDSDQHYPIFDENQIKTKYLVQTFRSLAGWKFNSDKIKNDLKLVYLEDNFQYFGDIDKSKSSGGTGKQYIVRNDLDYFVSKQSSFNLISEYQYNQGEGYQSGIQNPKRNQVNLSLLYRNGNSAKFYWELGSKYDFVEGYESPFLFSASGKYSVNDWYQTSINISRNFRAPTFNDLYWQPGGNLDLKPETSYQAEMSHYFSYKNFKLGITPYYIKMKDMIQWIPITSSNWSPRNVNKVDFYGLETDLSFNKNWTNQKLSSQIGYSYTQSTDLETKKQLSYVPFHQINFNTDYQYKIAGLFFQALYNSKRFTDNTESNFLEDYLILNAGITINPQKNIQIGFKVNNITDEIYETVDYYFMPKRNYAVSLKLNF